MILASLSHHSVGKFLHNHCNSFKPARTNRLQMFSNAKNAIIIAHTSAVQRLCLTSAYDAQYMAKLFYLQLTMCVENVTNYNLHINVRSKRNFTAH